MEVIDRLRHAPLRSVSWSADAAAAALDEIVADALGHFDADRFWPAHPLDAQADGNASFYFGATGVIWALEYLRRSGATNQKVDFRDSTDRLLRETQAQFRAFGEYGAHGSFLFGDLGTALLFMALAPDPSIADLVETRAVANQQQPIRELMWGTAGSMLACIHMERMTREDRWRQIFRMQAQRLLDDLVETGFGPLWTQDLYGEQVQYLGPVHGFAGNMIPLLHGWHWLSESERLRVEDAVLRTLTANAVRSESGINWPARISGTFKPLVQHCHGAPGMVTAFADAPFASPEFESLLTGGGDLVWSAGPLAKGSNLCHGTGGNGYAFLKLFRRTKNESWLDRARAFAMAAIQQCADARTQYRRGRYSLWTGDAGLAVYLWDCIRAEAAFPTIDVF